MKYGKSWLITWLRESRCQQGKPEKQAQTGDFWEDLDADAIVDKG